jgi:hypothetical protein
VKLRFILPLVAVAIGLGIWYYIASRPQPPPRQEPRPFVWSVEMLDLVRMQIDLPRRDLSEAWVKHTDRYWYFTEPDGPQVDMQRWGGGIPLLLSGPGANRLIVEAASFEQLATFGLDEPQMRVRLRLNDGFELEILIGDATPDQVSYYIKRADRPEVLTVDHTWFEVVERLVTEPPYPPAE